MPEEETTDTQQPESADDQDELQPEQPGHLTLEQALARLTDAQKALKKSTRDGAARDRRLQELEAAEAARQQAQMSETDRLKTQLTNLQAQLDRAEADARAYLIRAAVETAAARAGFLNPADALALADLSQVAVDEAGDVQGVDDAIKALLKTRPYLVKPAGDAHGTPTTKTAGRGAVFPGTPTSSSSGLGAAPAPAPAAPLVRF